MPGAMSHEYDSRTPGMSYWWRRGPATEGLQIRTSSFFANAYCSLGIVSPRSLAHRQ